MPEKTPVEFLGTAEAVAAHDAAHARADGILHRLAVRLMGMVGIEHMVLDGLDDGSGEEPLGRYPLVLRVEDGVIVESSGKLVGRLDLCRQVQGLRIEPGEPHGKCVPVYDLCLVRRTTRTSQDEGGFVPGEPVLIGSVCESGNFRFPALAYPLGDGLLIAHCLNGEWALNETGGVPCPAPAGLEDRQRGIWVVADVGSELVPVDVLVDGFEQVWKRPLSERSALLPDGESVYLETPEDLLRLPRGSWLVRWEGDVSDLACPLWFRYDAGAARPGQYVEYQKVLRGESGPDDLFCELAGGVRTQVHKHGEQVWVFADQGGTHNVSHFLGQIAEAARAIEAESFVLDGELLGALDSSVIRRALSRRKDLSDADLRFVAFDCLHLDGEDLHEEPLCERAQRLSALLTHSGRIASVRFSEEPTQTEALARGRDSAYDVTGVGCDWRVVCEDAKAGVVEDEREAEDAAEVVVSETAHNALSRLWVVQGPPDDLTPVRQEDAPVDFIYLRRYVGVDADPLHSSRLKALKMPFQDLVERYRLADFQRRPAIMAAALTRHELATDPARLVVPLSAYGELLIGTPPDATTRLVLRQEVVADAIQFAQDPEKIVEVGADDFISPDGNAQWPADQQWPIESTLDLSVLAGPGEVLELRASGRAILGTQKPRFHEVFLLFQGMPENSGRYVWNLITVNGIDRWVGRKPKEQMPYLFRHDQETEVGSARSESGWVCWNPEGIRALAASALANILPMNWDSRLIPYDDAPFTDFCCP